MKFLRPLLLFCLWLLVAQSATAGTATIQAVAVLPAAHSVSVRLALTAPVAPHAEALTSPDRIVIDLPEVQPAANLPVGQAHAPVRSVAVTQISSSPLLTRVTITLDSAQRFSISSSGNVLTLTLGAGTANAATQPSPAPPLTPRRPTPLQPGLRPSPAIRSAVPATPGTTAASGAKPSTVETEFDVVQPPPPPPPPKVLRVNYANGQLTIQSERSTLAEILAEVKKRTGAEMSVPGGAQEPVFCRLGPGPAREVLTQLLTGTNFNFIMTSDENDPTQLRSLMLLPKSGGAFAPSSQPAQPPPPPEPQDNGQPE
jgi:hypothetical protein